MPKVLLVILILLLSATLAFAWKSEKARVQVLGITAARNRLEQELVKQADRWRKVLEVFPTYKDAYVQLALINYQLGNIFPAKHYFSQAINLDPNWVIPPELSFLLP